MAVDYIIIGQGICGTWLAYYLLKENKSLLVFDKEDLQSASNIAGGLINPVTGRRVVTTWMAETLLLFTWNEYNALSNSLHSKFIQQKNILAFPAATDLQQAFNERIAQQNSFIQKPLLQKEHFLNTFNFSFDVFEINPCYVVEMRALLKSFRANLQRRRILMNEVFDEALLEETADGITYKNIKAHNVIYANGMQSAQSMYWKNLPFVPNKGQALVISVKELDTSYTYKFGHLTFIFLTDDLWWVGSSNELDFITAKPVEDFKIKTIASLKAILKRDFSIIEHWSALRAATVERRPFVGFHPLHKHTGILNGMGSKGCSLAPWFAKQLVQNMVCNEPLDTGADVKRFSKLLSKEDSQTV